jgi:phospholipid/cholesterol/gamma-HCH transport system ATP-binding protein
VSAVKQDTDNGVRHAIEVRGLDNRFEPSRSIRT